MRIRQIASLSLADLRHDWLVSLCIVMSLVAVIAPLLLLFGLKHGVVTTLQDQIQSDPRHLEIRMLSSGSYDQAWVDALASRPDVGFALGMTRSLNTQADFVWRSDRFLENVEVLPTALEDPLLKQVDIRALGLDSIVFSAQAANRLGVQANDTVRMRIARRLDGKNQQAWKEMTVHAVLAPEAYGRPAGFVSWEVLRDMEWYRDGYAVPSLDAAEGRSVSEAKMRFARARIYARDMNDVETLEKSLNAQRIETSSSLADIQNVKAINQLLTTVFSVVAGTALVGCLASLAGAFVAGIRRKRRDIATLRLLGLQKRDINTYILLQATVLTLFAFFLGLGAYFIGSEIFNQLLGLAQTTGQFVCRITVEHALIALALTLAVALFVSFVGASSAQRVQPAESLREI